MTLFNNAGFAVPPHPNVAHPIPGTGVKIAVTTGDTDDTVAVTAGESYLFTATTGSFYFGLDNVATDATNVAWVCPAGQTIFFTIPVGYTTLHYAADKANSVGFMRQVEMG